MNNTGEITTGLTAEVNVLDFNRKSVLDKTIPADSLSAQSTREVFTLPAMPDISKSWFLNLRLYNNQHQMVSTNFYVLSTEKDELDNAKGNWYVTPQSHYADLTLLQQLPAVKLEKNEIITVKGEDTYVQVKLKNPSAGLAFMVYLDLKNKDKNKSIVPVFWDDNYVTLLPGEERNISGHCHTSDIQGGKLLVTVKGWNVE
jgi:exo-1,4-beta-D-glucosaminidase